ncbi:hypothetical protein BJ944DRAFT_259308 [Cunninghamella echinulata]|nr:hypothetical protein BJ944DRAFT_259308 [Cunninghamella echinulata]
MSTIQGPVSFCKAGGIISNASRLLAASFLAVVGFNLVLIFVINIKRRDLVEYFYYPGVILYTLVCTAVSIYKTITMERSHHEYDTCWYLNYVADRQHAVFSWMWYYGFLFLINVCAVLFSIIALCKLVSEQRAIRENIDKNIYMGEASTNNNQAPNKYQTRRSTVISKVVIRCIVYPTIPLLVNIWGFVIQLMITIGETPPSFVISMFDTVFACLEGFFVAMVFYSDPALTEFVKSRIQHFHRIYVQEYRLIEVNQDEESLNDETNSNNSNSKRKSRTLYIMPLDYPGGKSDWDAAIIQATTTNSSSSPSSTKRNHQHKIIPMRKITIPPSTLNQLSANYNIHQLSFCNLLTVTPNQKITTTTVSTKDKITINHHDFDSTSSRDITSIPPNVSFNSNMDVQSDHLISMNFMLNNNNNNNNSQDNIIHEVFIPYDGPVFWTRFCHKLFSDFKLSDLFSCISNDRPSSTIVLRSHSISQTKNKYGLMSDSDDLHTSRHSSVDSHACHY